MAKKNTVKKTDKPSKTKKEDSSVQEATSGFSLSEFLPGTKEELAKVVWPSRQQLISESLAVISMVVLVATLIYFIDQFFAWGAGKVFG